MTDYRKMYLLLCTAVSASLDLLSEDCDTNAISAVRFWLKEAMLRAEHVYLVTAEDCEAQGG